MQRIDSVFRVQTTTIFRLNYIETKDFVEPFRFRLHAKYFSADNTMHGIR